MLHPMLQGKKRRKKVSLPMQWKSPRETALGGYRVNSVNVNDAALESIRATQKQHEYTVFLKLLQKADANGFFDGLNEA
jgi:hypothetical protein